MAEDKIVLINANKIFEASFNNLCLKYNYKLESVDSKNVLFAELSNKVFDSIMVWVDGLSAGVEISDKIPKNFNFFILRVFPKDFQKRKHFEKINWYNIDFLVVPESCLENPLFLKHLPSDKNIEIFALEETAYEAKKSRNFKVVLPEFPEPTLLDTVFTKVTSYLRVFKVRYFKKTTVKNSIKIKTNKEKVIFDKERFAVKKAKSIEDLFCEVLRKNQKLKTVGQIEITQIVNPIKITNDDIDTDSRLKTNKNKVQRVAQIIKQIFLKNIAASEIQINGDDSEFSEIVHFIKKLKAYESKILHAPVNIANQPYVLSKSLRKLGIYSKFLDCYPSWLNYKADWIIQPYIKLSRFTDELMNNYNLFHFHYGESLRRDRSDLEELSKMNKAIVMQYWGSDVRQISLAKKLNPYSIEMASEEDNILKLKKISKYVKACIVGDRELYEYVKDFHEEVYMLRQAIDLRQYSVNQDFQRPQSNKPIIVHAPTNFEIKGTEYIIKAIENLKFKYDFEFILVHGVSHEEAKKIYQKADLIIDQIRLGGYGLFSIESMAMGKPVVAWIADYFLEYYPKELPIIRANPDTIENVLEELLRNREILPEIGKKSREYVEKYHSIDEIKFELLAIYYLISKEAGLL